ncbi:MAG: cytochrome c3 family protein [Thermoanaerobaculia bacterium]
MSQIFKPSTNTLAKVSMFGALFFLVILAWVLVTLNRSSLVTRQGIVLQQPVPFSHDHHVAGLGISCLYCHTTVEESSFAGIPPSATCMNCHKLIWNESPMLEPVRESYRTGQPIEWTRVHDLPDFVYFDHSIHVAKGIGCASCHGRVDQMPLMYQAESLQMEWCLECHRAPERFIRPRAEIYNMEWVSADQETEGAHLIADYKVQSKLSCSVCHR